MSNFDLIKTSWLKSRFSTDGSVDQPPWELRFTPESGYHALALRDFVQGDVILIEEPLVWCSGHHPFDESQVEEIESKVESLSVEEQVAFYELANVFSDSDEYRKAPGIFMTNCFDMSDNDTDRCAIYLAIARLNHSCTPNAQFTFIPEKNHEVLIASRNIAKGDEINDCYIDLRQSTSQRQKEVQELYRFTCSCRHCTSPDSTADHYRQKAAKTDELILLTINEDGPEVAIQYALDAVRLLSIEENLCWSIRYLADAHLTVYQLAMAIDTSEYAKIGMKHLNKAYEFSQMLEGDDAPNSMSIKNYLDEDSEENK